MEDYGFIWPRAFVIWALAVVLFVVATRRAMRIRKEAARLLRREPSAFGDTKILFLVSFLLACGLARPYWGSTSIAPSAHGRDIVLVLDVSASMRATDSHPSRFQAMQREVNSLLEVSNGSKMHDRFGIVAFAGASAPLCPLTVDRAVVSRFLRALDPGIISTPGSGLEGALKSALDMIERSGSAGAGIVLVSDGEGSDGSPLESVERARREGVIISVLGIGTEEGTTLPGPRGDVLKDVTGNVVTSRLNVETLQEIATGTSGVFERARAGKSDVVSLYRSFGEVERDSESGVMRTIRNELTPWCALAAFLLFLAGAFRSPSVILPMLVLCQIGSPSFACADAESAAKMYRNGEYEGALKEFEALQKQAPDDPRYYHGAGSSAYRLKRFEEARESFDAAARLSLHPQDKFEALFNSGNSLFQGGKYKDAIARYDAALGIKPGDESSLQNRKLAEEALLQQPEDPTPTPTPDPSQEQEQEQGESSQDQQSGSDKEQEDEAPQEKKEEDSQDSDPEKEKEEEQQSSSNSDPSAQEDPSSSTESQSEANSDEPLEEARQGARAWLESLPDAPLLMRRDRSQKVPPGGQTW